MKPKTPNIDTIHTIVFDFDGVFTNNFVYLDQKGLEAVRCDRRDGLAIDLMRKFQQLGKLQAEMFILSTETNPVVASRAKKLKLTCHSGVEGKLSFLNEYFTNKPGNGYEGMIYLGNDLNDLPVIEKAGYSVVPSDAHAMVKSAASLVLPEKGGVGFVRKFVELFLGIDRLTIGEINELISNS